MGDKDLLLRFVRTNTGMLCHFVKSCSIFLLVNELEQLRGLANGAKGYLYNLDCKDNDVRIEALQFIHRHKDSSNMILPWKSEPSVITMVPVIKQGFTNLWKPNLTTVANDIVLPIPFDRQPIDIDADIKNSSLLQQMYDIGLMSTVRKVPRRALEILVFSYLK